MDGNWIQIDPKCQNKGSFKIVTIPSDYIIARVEPVSPRATTGLSSVKGHY
jgi:hypothetical protein